MFTENERNQLLIKEMHHRIKNNIQLISCLLEIFANDVDNEAVYKFVKDINLRFQTMMEVHNYLYSIDNCVDEINIQCYLNNLIQQMVYFHKIDTNRIKIDAKNVFLDCNTTLILGLIVNELLINSVKHNEIDNKNIKIRIFKESSTSDLYTFYYVEKVDREIKYIKNTVASSLKLIQLLIQQLNDKISFDIDFNKESVIKY